MATFCDVEFPSDSSDDDEYHPSLLPVQVNSLIEHSLYNIVQFLLGRPTFILY